MHDYVNERSTYAISILFPVLGTVSVVSRLRSRQLTEAGYGLDDVCAVLSLIIVWGCSGVLIAGDATHVIGWHDPIPTESAEVELSQNPPINILNQEFEFAFDILSVLGIGFIRLTFCFLYRRLFRHTTYKWTTWILVGIASVWTICFSIAVFFSCSYHIDQNWGSENNLAKYCPDAFPLQSSLSVSDAAIDIALLLFPIIPVYRLKMVGRNRVFVLVVFSLGIFSVAASITRMVIVLYLQTYSDTYSSSLAGTNSTSDVLGLTSVLMWWTYVEMGTGCLVSNLPVVIGLVRRSRWLEAFGNWCQQLMSARSWRLTKPRPSRSQSKGSEAEDLRDEGSYSKKVHVDILSL